MDELDFLIEESLFRIKRDYERTGGKIFLSFSGGKDSTVLAELIKMADLPTKIPFVFANTRIELNVTLDFVKNYPYENVVIVLPRKPFGQILKEHGKPAISKMKSQLLETYYNHKDNDPLQYARVKTLISGKVVKDGVIHDEKSVFGLKDDHLNFVHPDQEYKVANRCCDYMKKKPFDDFARDNDMNGSFSGIRTAEGGARAMAYKSCVQIKKKRGKEYVFSLPIIEWTKDHIEEFIKRYDVKLSDAYNVYGCDRTGCVACPFSRPKNIVKELEMVYIHEPLRYKASMFFLKDVYADQGIELLFDPEYMEYYKERRKIADKRVQEMKEKYKEMRKLDE